MNNTPTPRTDEEIQRYMMTYFITQEDDDGYAVKANFARQLETELTAITEQRDRLAEVIESIIGEAAFEGIPESKQQSIYEALQSIKQPTQ